MFLDPDGEIEKWGRDLPHWQQGEVMQFVTFRLVDSLPVEKTMLWREELKVWRTRNPEPWTRQQVYEYHRRFTYRYEKWLDRGYGCCLLREVENRSILEEVLMKFQGGRVGHESWVIMPNHVHLLFTPCVEVADLVKAWKGVSARGIGRGSIWQKNYRDTAIRDARHFVNAARYIRRNPEGLREGSFTLWEGERVRRI